MRVTGPYQNRATGAATSARRKAKSGSSFALPEDGASEAPGASSTGQASAVHGLDALLALQGVEDEKEQKRKAVRYGFNLLDSLDALRIDLLSGRIPAHRIEKVLANLSLCKASGDPELDNLIEEINLRARVELAKLGRFS